MFHFEIFEYVKRGRGRPKSESTASDREFAIKARYESGTTMQIIADEFGVSRERIRQILKKYFGITGKDGGFFVSTTASAIASAIEKKHLKKEKRDQRYQAIFGCDEEQFVLINGNNKRSVRGSIALKYVEQRRNAIHQRGINWSITFPEWWAVWKESGYWEKRGRGDGYCMSRIGDTGGYEIGNVEIKTIGENFSESFYKHPQESRNLKAIENGRARKKKTHCKRGHEFTVDNTYISNGNRSCKTCQKLRANNFYKEKLAKSKLPA